MGVDAVYVCRTCKTIYWPRHRMYWSDEFCVKLENWEIDLSELKAFSTLVERMVSVYNIGYTVLSFAHHIRTLVKWLEQHKKHDVLILGDTELDLMDLDDYEKEVLRDET